MKMQLSAHFCARDAAEYYTSVYASHGVNEMPLLLALGRITCYPMTYNVLPYDLDYSDFCGWLMAVKCLWISYGSDINGKLKSPHQGVIAKSTHHEKTNDEIIINL